MNSKIAMFVKYRNSCYELYGFDVLIDSNYTLHLLEINIVPSLHTTSPLDKKIKNMLVSNLLNLVGLQPFDRKKYAEEEEVCGHEARPLRQGTACRRVGVPGLALERGGAPHPPPLLWGPPCQPASVR